MLNFLDDPALPVHVREIQCAIDGFGDPKIPVANALSVICRPKSDGAILAGGGKYSAIRAQCVLEYAVSMPDRRKGVRPRPLTPRRDVVRPG